MESGLREKLRSILGDAPVSSITPTCTLDSLSTVTPPVARVPYTPPVSHELFQAFGAPAVDLPTGPTPPPPRDRAETNKPFIRLQIPCARGDLRCVHHRSHVPDDSS